MSEKGPPSRPRSAQEDAATRATLRPPHSAVEAPDFAKLVPKLAQAVQVPLGRLETTVFMRIDGRRSVLEIAQEVGLAPYEVLRIIERLIQLVPDLRLGQSEIVELSVDELWEEAPGPDDRTGEIEAPSTQRGTEEK